MKAIRCVIHLPPEELPKQWYNILPDLPEPLPPPQGEAQLQSLPGLMIHACLRQENATARWIDIPDEVRQLYLQAGRPRPLFRALNLERALKTPARLYYKAEFCSPTGSHKVNTALAQAFCRRRNPLTASLVRLTRRKNAARPEKKK